MHLGNTTWAFTSVESALIRVSPELTALKVTALSIGTPVKLCRRTSRTQRVNGVESHWYWVESGSFEGWIWGGLLTHQTSGSQRDPEVKFLLNYTSSDTTWMDGFYNTYLVADLRAIRKNKMLDRKLIKIQEPMMMDFNNRGTMGLKGIHDLLQFSISGESCGHFSGNVWIGWDGERFTDEWTVGGVPDGELYEGEELIFPISMDGKSDTVIVKGNSYEVWYDWSGVYDDQDNEVSEVIAWIESQREVTLINGHWVEVNNSLTKNITAYTLYSATGSKMYLPNQLPESVRNQIIIDKKNQK